MSGFNSNIVDLTVSRLLRSFCFQKRRSARLLGTAGVALALALGCNLWLLSPYRKVLVSKQWKENNKRKKTLVPNKWCGDWTPYLILDTGEHTVDTRKSPLARHIPSCSDSQVGQNYTPPSEQLYCHPSLSGGNRKPSILALDMHRTNTASGTPEYSVVMPSHSVASVLQETAPLLCQHTIGMWEVIFVLDSSYDDSLQVLREVLLSDVCFKYTNNLLRARVYVQPSPGIFETSCDNLGMVASHPSHFYVEVQADMFIMETGWNRDMARPLFRYNDIFSVSGRCGHCFGRDSGGNFHYTIGRCLGEVGSLGDWRTQRDTVNAAYVTETNNRGPILWRADALRELDFLDEVNFYLEGDEHDLNRRAAWRGWYPSYKYVHFYSPLDLSPSRNDKFEQHTPPQVLEQDKLYKEFRQKRNISRCMLKIRFSGDVSNHPFALKTEKRPLEPMRLPMDPDQLLPALPPLVTNSRADG